MHRLLIDDDPLLGRLYQRACPPDIQLTVAPSAEDALSRLFEGLPVDILVCDLRLPGMSGVDLYPVLRGAFPDLAGRTLFMTGGHDLDDPIAEALLGGRVLSNPARPEEVWRRARTHLRAGRRNDLRSTIPSRTS